MTISAQFKKFSSFAAENIPHHENQWRAVGSSLKHKVDKTSLMALSGLDHIAALPGKTKKYFATTYEESPWLQSKYKRYVRPTITTVRYTLSFIRQILNYASDLPVVTKASDVALFVLSFISSALQCHESFKKRKSHDKFFKKVAKRELAKEDTQKRETFQQHLDNHLNSGKKFTEIKRNLREVGIPIYKYEDAYGFIHLHELKKLLNDHPKFKEKLFKDFNEFCVQSETQQLQKDYSLWKESLTVENIKEKLSSIGIFYDKTVNNLELLGKMQDPGQDKIIFQQFVQKQKSVASIKSLLHKRKAEFEKLSGRLGVEGAQNVEVTNVSMLNQLKQISLNKQKNIRSLSLDLKLNLASLGVTTFISGTSFALAIAILAGASIAAIATTSLGIGAAVLTAGIMAAGFTYYALHYPNSTKAMIQLVGARLMLYNIMGFFKKTSEEDISKQKDQLRKTLQTIDSLKMHLQRCKVDETIWADTSNLPEPPRKKVSRLRMDIVSDPETSLKTKQALYLAGVDSLISTYRLKASKIRTKLANYESKEKEYQEIKVKKDEMERRQIEAGWKDFVRLHKLAPVPSAALPAEDLSASLASYLYYLHENNAVEPDLKEVLLSELGIDLDGQSKEDLSFSIKKFASMDQDQMSKLIRKLQKKASLSQ